MKKVVRILSIAMLTLGVWACQPQEEVNPASNNSGGRQDNDIKTTNAVRYSSSPSIGGFTSCGAGMSTTCGIVSGGGLKTKIVSQSGAIFILEVSKCDNKPFTYGGSVQIKSSSLCGTAWSNKIQYVAGAYSVRVSITAYFPARQTVNLWAITQSSPYGAYSHSSPFSITSY